MTDFPSTYPYYSMLTMQPPVLQLHSPTHTHLIQLNLLHVHTPPFTHIIQPLTPIFSSIILKPIPFIFTFLQPIHLWIPKHHLSSTITQPIYLSNSTSSNPYNHGYSLHTTCTHSIFIVNKLFWSICMVFNNSLIRIIQATLILAIFQFSNSVSGFEAIVFFFFF